MTKAQITEALRQATLSDLARAMALKRDPATQRGGRKRSAAERCPCGEMTLKRAVARGHKCEEVMR